MYVNINFFTQVLERVNIVLRESFLLFEHDSAWSGRTGAYFCLANRMTGLPLLIASVGSVHSDKVEKYLTFCQEKAKRLRNNGRLSSWESRNPAKNQWGGAVAINDDLIFSMSGLPELGDEAVMLASAYWIYPDKMAGLVHLDEIARRSNNPYWEPLKDFLNR